VAISCAQKSFETEIRLAHSNLFTCINPFPKMYKAGTTYLAHLGVLIFTLRHGSTHSFPRTCSESSSSRTDMVLLIHSPEPVRSPHLHAQTWFYSFIPQNLFGVLIFTHRHGSTHSFPRTCSESSSSRLDMVLLIHSPEPVCSSHLHA